jgi:hypothetical protein
MLEAYKASYRPSKLSAWHDKRFVGTAVSAMGRCKLPRRGQLDVADFKLCDTRKSAVALFAHYQAMETRANDRAK